MTSDRPDEATPSSQIDLERFARQVRLDGVGLAGQRRLQAARYRLHGDPAIVEPALRYLRAAGAADGVAREDGDVIPGAASCAVGATDRAPARTVRVVARRGDVVVGERPSEPPSPLADAGDLEAAGMMLAIEALRLGMGASSSPSWSLLPRP